MFVTGRIPLIYYSTRVEVTDSDKHSSFLRHSINYDRKKFYSTFPSNGTTNPGEWAEMFALFGSTKKNLD